MHTCTRRSSEKLEIPFFKFLILTTGYILYLVKDAQTRGRAEKIRDKIAEALAYSKDGVLYSRGIFLQKASKAGAIINEWTFAILFN